MQAILKASIYAPNGGNTQMWHFTVLQKQNTLKELNELIRKAFAKNAGSDNRFINGAAKVAQSNMFCFYYGAPTLILVYGDVVIQMLWLTARVRLRIFYLQQQKGLVLYTLTRDVT